MIDKLNKNYGQNVNQWFRKTNTVSTDFKVKLKTTI